MTTLTPTTEAVDADLDAFFAAISWDGGRVEVVAGTNQADNPDKIDLITYIKGKRATTRRWIAPDDVTELEKAITRLAEQWGNVYVSVGTYDEVPNRHRPGTMTYNRSAPRPRRCFILDDVTDILALRLPPTWANETSPDNYQVGYTCTDLLIPKQAEMLGKGAMLLARTDASGWDATQIIRIPGTMNTKPTCAGRAGDPKAGIEPEGWTVRLLFADGPRYTPQQLATAFLPGGMTELGAAKHSCSGKSERATVPVDREMLARLPDGAALMNTPRYRALFCCRPQLAQLAAGETVILPTKYGLRGSGSEQVAVLVANLLTTGRSGPDKKMVAGLGAPPWDEVRAIALFWRERLRPGYDIGRYIEDVERLISEYTPAGYAPEPTHITGESIPSHPALLPARKPGRPYGPRDVATDALLSHCATLPIESDGWTRTTTKALAKHLNLSPVHIGRLLSDVRRTGQLESRTEPRALALRLIPKEGAFNDEGHHLLKGAFNDEGHHSPSLDRIETRNDGGECKGSTHPPAPVPALPSCSDVADEQSHTATLVVAPEPNGGCVLPPHVDDLPVILANPEPVVSTAPAMVAAPVALLPEQPAPALVAGSDSPIAPNTDAHHEWLRRAAIAPRPAPVTPERLAEIIARIRNEQTASPEPAQPEPEPELIPEQPAPVPASTDSTNIHQPAPELDHRAWLRRARTTPHAAPPTPERLAEIIARLRASSPPSQPDDTPQPAPEQPHDGSGAESEDCAAHDKKTTLQEGSGATEQTLSTHSHVRDVIAPQKPVQPAHEQTIATVIARIEIARTEIRYTKRETLNRETGELVEKATKAMKHRVRAIVSDVPDALFDAAWKKANDVWLTYRAKLEQCDAIGLAFAVRDTARKHADAVRKDSPRVKFYAAQSRIAAEICARRGVDPLDPTGKQKLRATQAQAKAQAKAQAERRGKVASLFVPSVAQRPLFEYTPVACAD